MKVKFEHIQKALQKDFDNKMKQLRFNSMLALNDVAQEIKKNAVPESFKDEFTVRNKQFPKRTQFKRATTANLEVDLTFPHEQMEAHATGGEKVPGRSHDLAIPMPDLQQKSFRSAKGVVKRNYKPSTLISDKKAFVLTAKSGKKYVARHTKTDTEFLYRLKPEAKLKKDFDFKKICVETRDKFLGNFLEKRLKEAKAKNRL